MMKPCQVRFLIELGIITGFFMAGGCSTSELNPAPPPIPPAYTQVPHPNGNDVADLRALFLDSTAPQLKAIINTCAADYQKLRRLTQSINEVTEGTKQLVKQDPVQYHWCFYGKLLALENFLKSETYVEERQTRILSTFVFVSAVARAFSSVFHDSRYLRWAVAKYQKLSRLYFYRNLVLTPEGTSELVQASNPFGLWRDSSADLSVLEKYRLVKTPEPQPSPSTLSGVLPDFTLADAALSQEVTPVPTPSSTPIATPSPTPSLTPTPLR